MFLLLHPTPFVVPIAENAVLVANDCCFLSVLFFLIFYYGEFNTIVSRNSCRRKAKSVNGIRAASKEQSGTDSGPVKPNAKPQRYHPFEEIAESAFLDSGDATLTPAETTRTIIEV